MRFIGGAQHRALQARANDAIQRAFVFDDNQSLPHRHRAQRFLNHLTNLLAKLLYHFTVDDNLQLAVGGAIFTIRSLDSCVPASASLTIFMIVS
jgi:hypothetical protein